jgi:hypothetical protein
MESTLKLFKALPIDEDNKKTKEPTSKLLKKTMKHGFIYSPEVVGDYNETVLISKIKEIGITSKQMNSSFHKSWKKVRDADMEDLIIEQIIHYITTYGFRQLGIYDKNTVFIPNEKLKVLKIKDDFNFIIIKGYTKKELKFKLLDLLSSGIALKEDTIKDVVDVATYVELNSEEIGDTKNKEVKAILYDYLGSFPENPIEFLRYLVYKATNKTLLIKNKEIIKMIKDRNNMDVLGLLVKYKQSHGLEKLSEIFNRFKPLFLAFKTNSQLKTIVNKIRKLSIKHHKPIPSDYLNRVTALIRKDGLDIDYLKEKLKSSNTFRKIRLAYALNYRSKKTDSILYKIRNGKSYSTEFNPKRKKKMKECLKIVIEHIIDDIKNNVDGKKIFIPKNIKYALPATEKQFTGYFPTGSYITIPNSMVFGIYWKNVESNIIDLDLSLINNIHGKMGWDASYRSDDRSILFSGDITNPSTKYGASELFYIKKAISGTGIVLLNYYNYNDKITVPYRILVAKKDDKQFKRNYMINPNNMIATSNSTINKKQQIIGLVVTSETDQRFYFTESSMGNSITSSSKKEYIIQARNYFINYYTNSIILNDILKKAGAVLVKEKNDCDIDLSPESLEKDSIIKLLK